MAVHTPITKQQLVDFIAPLGLGDLIAYAGITDGMENTNYSISIKAVDSSSSASYILTLFEKLTPDEVAFYLQLMTHLATHGLPVPLPVELSSANAQTTATDLPRSLLGKPAALLTKLSGTHPLQPNAVQCRAIGIALAQQHLVTRDLNHPHSQQLDNLLSSATVLLAQLNGDDRTMLVEELGCAHQLLANSNLPRGIIHGDLFRDNALFDGDTLTGLLDYYSASYAPLMLDIAITANDWCCTDDFQLDALRVSALLNGYQSIRPLEQEELTQWHNALRVAALRFWISRLLYQSTHQLAAVGAHAPNKDPNDFRQRLIYLRKS